MDSKRKLRKRVAMFLSGFNLLQPVRVALNCAIYTVTRFKIPTSKLGLFINMTNISITVASSASCILMSLYLILIAPNFGLSKYNRYLSIGTNWLVFIFDLFTLIAFSTGGGNGHITFYYWMIVMSAFSFGLTEAIIPTIDPYNIPFFTFGVPFSAIQVFLYHIFFLYIAAKLKLKDISYKIVVGQLSISIILSLGVAVIWTLSYYELKESKSRDYIQLQIEQTGNYSCKVNGTPSKTDEVKGTEIAVVEEQNALVGYRKYKHLSDANHTVSGLSNKDICIEGITLPTETFISACVYMATGENVPLLVELCTERRRGSVPNYTYYFKCQDSQWKGYIRYDNSKLYDHTEIALVLPRLKFGLLENLKFCYPEVTDNMLPNDKNKDLFKAVKGAKSPILIYTLALGTIYAFYPSVIPYKLIDHQRGYCIDLAVILITSLVGFINCLMANLPCLERFNPQVDWKENKKWQMSWFVFTPYVMCTILGFLALHYRHWGLSRFIRGNIWIVGLMSVTINACTRAAISVAFSAAPSQKSCEKDSLTEKYRDNDPDVVPKLVAFNSLAYQLLGNVVTTTGAGYHRVYERYQKDKTHWPTQDYNAFSAFWFWVASGSKEAWNSFTHSFTSDLRAELTKEN
ncbi:hypothetical protein BEWA_002620 [Theileria equi strain WA]|uniref:Uncharacterized protein n=1 Tax=Theileria equi strain WA TaxID=1537102 RepID=L0AZ68_THEEQ|nr:hypothetical protein BEWA_002620 [Theileria equi strain WA]AFZ80855.1 hypothetical protein BEWA_002620 [Theileria equi strain WA]|eukprot:XP_004830521.1 hypothetical protein BEWA_002620 [Theileria equi strain WA]